MLRARGIGAFTALAVFWAAALYGITSPAQDSKTTLRGGGKAPHGALEMHAQQKMIDRWLSQSKHVSVPQGVSPSFWHATVPADNPGTPAQVKLGRALYFDVRLSKDGSVACASCHDTSRGFADQRNTSEGIGDQIGQRNAPTVMNAMFFQTQFLDGRALSLEDQAKLPIINPIEMGMPDGAAATAAIEGDVKYQAAFKEAYGRPPNYDDIGRALAAFERTLVFLDAPLDRFLAGQSDAISEDAQAGWALFNGKARCISCHQMSSSSPIGTDNRFHNIGVSARHQDFEKLAKQALGALSKDSSQEAIDRLALETNLSELGRFVVSRNRSDIGAFKTSQIRNVGTTGPYMHDGSMATLWDVVDHYNKGGEPNPFLDGGIEPLNLSEQEIDQLVAFMFTLTDSRLAEQNKTELAHQTKIASERRPFRDNKLADRKVLPFEVVLKGRK